MESYWLLNPAPLLLYVIVPLADGWVGTDASTILAADMAIKEQVSGWEAVLWVVAAPAAAKPLG